MFQVDYHLLHNSALLFATMGPTRKTIEPAV